MPGALLKQRRGASGADVYPSSVLKVVAASADKLAHRVCLCLVVICIVTFVPFLLLSIPSPRSYSPVGIHLSAFGPANYGHMGAAPLDSPAAAVPAAHMQQKKMKVILAVTDEFFPVLINWAYYFLGTHGVEGIDDFFFLCMDAGPNEKIKKLLGVPCHAIVATHVYNSPLVSLDFNINFAAKGVQSKIWIYRAETARQLLLKGYDVLFADLDAYWLRSPFPAIDALLAEGFDIVGSRGTYPEDVAGVYNSTLCLGFSYFRSVPGLVQVWDQAVKRMWKMQKPDDQMFVNRIMFLDGRMQPAPAPAENATVASPRPTFRGSFRIGSDAMQLAILSTDVASRSCNASTHATATVAHCYSGEKLKVYKAKNHHARHLGLWKVRRDWEATLLKSRLAYNGTGTHDPSKLLAVLTQTDYSLIE